MRIVLLFLLLGAARSQNGYPRDSPSNPFNEGSGGDEIPGEPGVDYPTYEKPPRTSFSCSQQQYPGYYADPEAQCQAYYVCQRGGRGLAVLCPIGTVFNQETLVCDWWFNVDCSRARDLYNVNEQINRAMQQANGNSGYRYSRPQNFPPVDRSQFSSPDRSYLPPSDMIVRPNLPDRTYLPPVVGRPDRMYLPSRF